MMFPVDIFLPEKLLMQETIRSGHTRGQFADNFEAMAVI